MEPMSRYYFDKEGVFKLRSKWPRRVRIFISIIFFIFSASFIANKVYTAEPTFSDLKYDRIELISSMDGVNKKDAEQIIKSTYKWSKEFKVDSKLVLAVAQVESAFNKHAISTSGAYGVMQVIPLWHKDKIIVARAKLGNPELFNINTNIFLGTWILSECLQKYRGSVHKALQCYSGQTPGYSDKVLLAYNQL